MRRLRVSSTMVSSLLALCGCGGGDDDCGEPLYAGNATDEAWRTMVDGEDHAVAGDPDGPTITVPTEGQVFAASDAAPEFVWTSPIASATRGPATRIAVRRIPKSCVWNRLAGLFVGTALAHRPPITGDIYLLRVDVPGHDCPIDVFTTDLSWQVDAASWTAMREAGGALSIDLISAYLTENRITEGPYRPSAPRTFSFAP